MAEEAFLKTLLQQLYVCFCINQDCENLSTDNVVGVVDVVDEVDDIKERRNLLNCQDGSSQVRGRPAV